MTGSGRWTRKPTAASSANLRGTSVKYGCTILCFDPKEIPSIPMPKLQSKSPTPQTESQYIPTQIKTGGEGEKKKSEIFDNANPPAPSNPMHQNCRIPYTNAYQRISTNAETRHNAGLQYGQHKCERPVREWGVK
ncbi:hypothetical protein PDIG_52840 [Penicillium digitatum PHI26]|uniref:Uncharacterized protein n=2 Tax=Penicillium digitatum TaxID=36651 RepID=K9GCN1_PEND2|nr:hypothetical protein PDIP_48060 [Penicillium digitatum Pd1]EKV11031.1 hypothetical protein PDIG_52840 [Penicillium digitatum PHI26]EKV13401.1 hypothetical protein PDIP_48060 [Penicillium digitatum Pd1]